MLVTTSILYFVLPGKEPACQCSRLKRHRFDSWVWKILWRRTWQPTPVFSPGESHGQRSLAAYSLWGCRVGHDWSNLVHSTHKLHFIEFHLNRTSQLPRRYCTFYKLKVCATLHQASLLRRFPNSTNSMCSLHVSVLHFGSSCNVSIFFIIILVMVICDVTMLDDLCS